MKEESSLARNTATRPMSASQSPTVAGGWRYGCRAVDEHGQVIDVVVSVRRDFAGAGRFFVGMLAVQEDPEWVTTDRAAAVAAVMAELLPAAVHDTEP
jgi:transposase, IS6 family